MPSTFKRERTQENSGARVDERAQANDAAQVDERAQANDAAQVDGRAQAGGATRSDSVSPQANGQWLATAILVIGYGLFRGTNSSSYLSAFSSVEKPFLFIPDIFFNIVVALTAIITASIIVVLAFKGRLPALGMPYKVPIALLLAANFATAIGAFDLLPPDIAVFLPGVLFGVSSTMLSLSWVELIAIQKPDRIMMQIALATLVSAFLSLTMSNLAPGTRAAITCAILVIMTACLIYTRKNLPRVLGDEAGWPLEERCTASGYRKAFLGIGDSLVAFFVLEAAIGVLNSFMLAGSISFAGAGSASTMAMIGAVMVFCAVVFLVQRVPRASTVFRMVAPALAAMLVFLPFLSETYNLFFSTLIMGSYYFVAMLVVFVAAETSYTKRVSIYVIMGATAGIGRLFLLTALVAGYTMGSAEIGAFGEAEDTMRFLIIIVIVIYALSMALVFISRGQRKIRDETEGATAMTDDSPQVPDATSREQSLEENCLELAQEQNLTERETEIFVYLARGHTNAHIGKTLFVSENTVRSHVRSIYSKLEVHTRQELIDLVESYGT